MKTLKKYTIIFDVNVEAEDSADALWKARDAVNERRCGEDITCHD